MSKANHTKHQMNDSCDYIFNRKLFTPVFWKIRHAHSRFVINYGGTSSSKSFSQYQLLVMWTLEDTRDTLVIRKYGTDLENSCYDNIKHVIRQWGLSGSYAFAFSGAKRYIRNLETGSRVLFRGLDDPEKIKSIFGIKRIVIEEANQLTIEDFKELNRRARGIEGIQIYLLFNPIIETHWIKEYFFDNPPDNVTIIHSTYKDNPFLTDEDRSEIERLKDIDINDYNVYGLGLWGKPGVKRPFARGFGDHHIAEGLSFDYRIPVYLSFDFNVDPITCTAHQTGAGWWNVVREFRLPDSDIYDLCTLIKQSFPGTVYMRVTGDATGTARSAMTKGHTNYYRIIKNELQLTSQQFDVPTSNPSHKDSRALMIVLLNSDFKFRIDKSCHFTIEDLRYVEVDDHGDIAKREAEKEGMGHLLDTLRYMAYTYLKKYLKHSLMYRLQNK